MGNELSFLLFFSRGHLLIDFDFDSFPAILLFKVH